MWNTKGSEILVWISNVEYKNEVKWSDYENNQQDTLYRLIYYSKSPLHVSGDVFAHHQEHLTVFRVSGSVHPIRDTSRQQLGWTLPDTVNKDKCSWWWAKNIARNMYSRIGIIN